MPTVVLIDDHRATLRALTRLLRGHGLDVVTFEEGKTALAWIKAVAQKPALVLLDVMMPGLDGFETLEHLRAMPEASGIPVVMVSASSDEEYQGRSRELGAADYWVKGTFDPAGISSLMAKYLGGQG